MTTDIAVLERLLSPAGKDVLDVGCGDGSLVRELGARGARVTGIEISEERLAVARENDLGGFNRYLVGRAEKLPLADASVDVVVFMRTLHHIAVNEMPRALKEARRVLRRGGAVYVAEPLAEGSFFELTSLVDDERAVLRAAHEALGSSGEDGMRRIGSLEYEVEGRFAGVGAFRALVVGVDPERTQIFTERETEIAIAFEELGQPGAVRGERCFHQPLRVDLLRPDEREPTLVT